MHVVQMFNMVIGWKHTLKRPFYIIFMLKKPCLKVKILQYKFLDWKWPPSLRNFSENSSDLLTWPAPKQQMNLKQYQSLYFCILVVLPFCLLIFWSRRHSDHMSESFQFIFWSFGQSLDRILKDNHWERVLKAESTNM